MGLLSVVVPMKDERANVRPLVQRVREALDDFGPWELVLVDDGSVDGTHLEIQAIASADARIKLVRLRKNFGQSAAMQAGLDHAEGDIIATMDGDLQNDPADLPRMIAALDEGYDCVLGERVNRQDKLLLRKIPSRCANWLIRKVLGVPFRDFGCTLRVMTREVAESFRLYGEMHRFISALAVQGGASVVQMPVRHHPRTAGVSKYNLSRTVRVLLDLTTVKFMDRFHTRPMHLFGGFALLCLFAGTVCLVSTPLIKLGGGPFITGNPLLIIGAMLELMGVQFLSLGLLGEVMARDHFERRGQEPYKVRETMNVNPDEELVRFNDFVKSRRTASVG
jgi:glycosyltransferase involved in cell wall biosynthesis